MPFRAPAFFSSTSQRYLIAAIAVSLTIAIAGGLYSKLAEPPEQNSQGSPSTGLPSVDEMVAHVEAHLQTNPDDGRAWEIMAPVYMRLGRYADSVGAWQKALQKLGDTSERASGLGEAMVAQANGVVTAEAKAAFAQALSLDPKSISARYYLGLSAEQDGHHDEALKIWRELLAEGPTEQYWTTSVRQSIARLEGTSIAKPATATVSDKTPTNQSTMIEGMVDRLAARLKQDGSDVDGWLRLVRSYKVLNKEDEATAAVNAARQALANDPAKLQQLNASLSDAGKGVISLPKSPVAATAVPSHQSDVSIQTTVERLAERLKNSGSDPAGWIMLARSYSTLGDKKRAEAAIEDGRRALAKDPDKLAQFNDLAKRFELGK